MKNDSNDNNGVVESHTSIKISESPHRTHTSVIFETDGTVNISDYYGRWREAKSSDLTKMIERFKVMLRQMEGVE